MSGYVCLTTILKSDVISFVPLGYSMNKHEPETFASGIQIPSLNTAMQRHQSPDISCAVGNFLPGIVGCDDCPLRMGGLQSLLTQSGNLTAPVLSEILRTAHCDSNHPQIADDDTYSGDVVIQQGGLGELISCVNGTENRTPHFILRGTPEDA